MLLFFALMFGHKRSLFAFDSLNLGEFLQLNFNLIHRKLELFVQTRYSNKLRRRIQLLLILIQILLKDLLLVSEAADLFESLVLNLVDLLLRASRAIH